MEALELFKIRERMCKQGCKKCPVSYTNNGFQIDCLVFMFTYPEKFEQLVEHWAVEHPLNSRKSVLKELFPNVEEKRFDVPNICPRIMEGKTASEYKCATRLCRDCVKNYWEGEYVK